MKKRTKVSGARANLQRAKAAKAKRGDAAKAARSSHSPTLSEESDVTRLARELNEAREQQAATSEILKVISSSPSDIQPLFDAMLEKAAHICGAKFGNIYRWGADGLHLAAT
jgi:hypothetical protein